MPLHLLWLRFHVRLYILSAITTFGMIGVPCTFLQFEGWVRFYVSPFGAYVGRRDTWTGFSLSTSAFPCHYHSSTTPTGSLSAMSLHHSNQQCMCVCVCVCVCVCLYVHTYVYVYLFFLFILSY